MRASERTDRAGHVGHVGTFQRDELRSGDRARPVDQGGVLDLSEPVTLGAGLGPGVARWRSSRNGRATHRGTCLLDARRRASCPAGPPRRGLDRRRRRGPGSTRPDRAAGTARPRHPRRPPPLAGGAGYRLFPGPARQHLRRRSIELDRSPAASRKHLARPSK